MPSYTAQKAAKPDERVDLLQDYKNWGSPKYQHAELLQEYLEYPSKRLWFQACHQAVKDKNREWLENPPLDRLYSRAGRSNAKRKNTARFISTCALKALLMKQVNQSIGRSEVDFQDIVKDVHVSNESIKDLIQYFVSERQQLEDEKVAVKVLLAGNEGKLGQLEIEKIPNGEGKIFPDPAFMAFSRFEPDFEESIKTAFKYISHTERLEEAKKYNYRWRLLDRSNTKKEDKNFGVLDQPLRGSSMGFASALAFRQLFRPLKFSLAKYAFTGKIDANGVLKSVGEYPSKLQAGKNLTIYFPDIDHEEIKHYSEDGYSIKEAVNVTDAIADIKNKNRKQRLISAGVITGIVAGIILLTASVYAWRASSLQVENERKQKELISRQRKLEKQYDDQQLELERQRTDVARKDAEAQKQDKLNEENKRKNAEKETQLSKEREALATQESKNLAQKNVQLDAAKQTAEKNEREAQFQKGIAENNEKIAQASQQIAYASRLAAEGYKRLADGDKNSAQTFFAKALSLDNRDEYRSGLLNASFDEPIRTKLSWSGDVGDDFRSSGTAPVSSLNFSGETVAVSYNNGRNVRILDTLGGDEVSNLSFEQPVTAIALSPNNKYLAVRTTASKLAVLELTTEKIYFETDVQPAANVDSIAFNSDGRYLASNDGNNGVLVLEVATKKIIKNFSHADDLPNAEILSLAFSADDYLAYGFSTLPYQPFADNPIYVRSIKGDSEVKRVNSSGMNFNLGFTQNELITSTPLFNVMAMISSDFSSEVSFSGGITLFTNIIDTLITQEDQEEPPAKLSLKQSVRPDYLFAASPNAAHFVSTGDHGFIRFWVGDKQLQQISFPMGKPVKIMMGENGRVLFLNTSGKIYCWETDVTNYYMRKNRGFENQSFVPAKSIEIYEDAIVVTDNRTNERVFTYKRDKAAKDNPWISISPDGNKIGLIHDGKTLEVYDAKTRDKIFERALDKKNDVCCLKFSNDGRKVAVTRAKITYTEVERERQKQSVTQSHSVDVFDLSNPEFQAKITLPTNLSKIFHLAEAQFSPKGTFYIIHADEAIYFFDSATGQLKQSVPYQQVECNLPMNCQWFAVSPDEKYVGITYLENQTVQLWNLENYRYLMEIIKTGVSSPEFPVGVGFTKNSQLLVWSSGSSGRLHFYDVKSKRKLADLPMSETIFQVTNDINGNLIINGTKKLDEDNLYLNLSGSPDSITSQLLSKNGFKINSPNFGFASQAQIDSILPDRKDSEMVAVTKNGSEEKGESDFGGVEVEKVKTNADGTSTQCPTAFAVPIFNPYPLTFASPANFCSHYPVIDVRPARDGGKYSPDEQTWLSTRSFNAGEYFYVLMYVSNGAANNLSSDVVDAKNVKIKVKFNSLADNEYLLTATFIGDNLAPLSSSVKVKIPPGTHLIHYEKAEIYGSQGKAPPLAVIDLSKAIKQDGEGYFYEIPIGELKPGFGTDLFIRFYLSVKEN